MRGFTLADVAFLAPKGPVDVIEVSDDFNRSNSATLGGTWEASDGAWEIFSNQARHTGGVATVVSNTVAMSSTNHWVSFEHNASNVGAPGACGRMNAGETQFYMAAVGAGGVQLYRYNGSFTLLGQHTPLGLGTVTLRCVGSTISVQHNGVTRVSVTDSTFTHSGVGMRANSGAGQDVYINYFAAGTTI